MPMWKEQIDSLKIPYPQKVSLSREIEAHIEFCPEEADQKITKEDLNELYRVHNTLLLRLLENASPTIRSLIEFLFAGGPMMALFIYLGRENFMLDFIMQGGAGTIVVLVVGALLLVRELHLLWRVVLIKDHSKKNLNLDTTTVAIGVMALVLIGLCATGLGTYATAAYVEQKGLPSAVFIVGLRESITCLILSTSIAAVILFLHFFTRRTLLHWQVPANLVG